MSFKECGLFLQTVCWFNDLFATFLEKLLSSNYSSINKEFTL